MSEDPYYVLELVRPDGAIDSFDISGETCIIGRSSKRADLVLEDSKASGQHAEIRFDGRRVSVQDLGSTNGTHFDGRRTREAFPLQPGQWFGIGDSKVRLVTIRGHEPPPPRHAPPIEETDEATRALSAEALEALKDDYGPGPALPEDAAGRTVAFDRASVPIGAYDGREREEAAPAPASSTRGRGLVAWLGLVLIAPYAIAIGVLVTATDLLGPVLGGEQKENAVRNSERAAKAAEAGNMEEAQRYARYAAGDAKSLSEHMDRSQMMLWIGMGAGLVGGLLAFFGFPLIGGVVILAGIGAPFAIWQPTPVEPIYFTGPLALYALAAMAAGFMGRRG